MEKKKKCILGISLVLGVVIGSIVTGKVQKTEKVKPSGMGSMIAMYIQDEDGNYNLSDNQKFPTDGYVLNTEKSSCKNGGKITQNPNTKALSLKVKTSDECTVYFEIVKPLLETVLNKSNSSTVTNYEDGEKTEMYVFDHDDLTTTTTITDYDGTTYTHSATQVADWTSEERRDYRYIGNEPNNYITFNGETWRIIGVFTVETESGEKKPLMKIIRNESIGFLPWDGGTDGSIANEWSTASLQRLLNGEYYNTEGSFSYTYKTSSSSTGTTVTIPKGLNAIARSQITKVKWYLGGSATDENLGGPDYYNFERGETTCVTEGNCNGQTRTTSIIANVGLMYPSDYVYTYGKGVNDKCYTDGLNCDSGTPSAGWLFNSVIQWTISPNVAYAYFAFFVDWDGLVRSNNVRNAYGVRPVVFLDSKIAIKSGDGSQGNPYAIG